ncbi:putative LRR receptor-like serine/threonine-protein kinase At1g53440 [Tasmannia lanceolata]|uniref:putative LRR receptor-like serine/threonine-protein kinase At1g53440 n=1 Tax=Tasmannia lanceolata TaxID=3420 RepID=UPI00406372CD
MKPVLAIWNVFFVVILFFLGLNCFGELRSEAQKLPDLEVEALRQIQRKLGVKGWDLNVNPCGGSGTGGWLSVEGTYIVRNITCDCTYESSTVCHVKLIWLKGQNLTGELPEEFSELSFLEEIDLTLNNLNGSIPARWASLPLVHLSLLGNRISGTIPKTFGNITTLKELILEDNQLEGPLPSELGNLTGLERFTLSANNITGTLPETYGELINLTDFRIDGNGIYGAIPDFIGSWTKLKRLDMQGTSMEGPIPASISLLQSLIELRVSDLNGPSANFPALQNLTNLQRLILRNCLISGEIPEYIGNNMTNLKTLDLSFNNLTGKLPDTFNKLQASINYMYLSNNMLTGVIPQWILQSGQSLDLSGNNFTGPHRTMCPQASVNLVASYSSSNDSSLAKCLQRNLPCSEKATYYSLFINCGGKKLATDEHEYEDDSSEGGPSTFYYTQIDKWAYSSTGDFMGAYMNAYGAYRATNKTVLATTDGDPGLYTTARLAPLSLKYYGFCLQNGNYKVQLHFAEIMFADDQTFGSNGKRIFDVSIQGEKVLKDFNIEDRAGGPGRGISIPFNKNVTSNTLEIHLYWAGNGTTAVPDRGVYGPLISAITVTPNFRPDTGKNRLSVGAIVGIIASSCVVIIVILICLWMKGCLGRKDLEDPELRGLELPTGYFSLKQIKAATNNFNPANKIGEGGFGPVYKGILSDGTTIAVKQLSSKSKQGNREFINEIGMISAIQHPNLVRLYGCCVEGNQLLVIYEYMENNSLARALIGREEYRLKVDWPTRRKICLGIARGLAYLHEESRLKIVHRDIKATNILLDKDLNAKISDFGLAKLDEEENTHISTRIAGTIGYMAPEYAMRGYLTDKADVYSFGVVLLEIVSGKSNTNYMPKEEFVYLLDWAYVLQEQGDLLELVDSSLGSNYSEEEALRMLNLALLCTNPSPSLRPAMSATVRMLEGKEPVKAPLVKRSTTRDDWKFRALEKRSKDRQTQSMSIEMSRCSHESQTHSMSIQRSYYDSSVSLLSREESDNHSSASMSFIDLYVT